MKKITFILRRIYEYQNNKEILELLGTDTNIERGIDTNYYSFTTIDGKNIADKDGWVREELVNPQMRYIYDGGNILGADIGFQERIRYLKDNNFVYSYSPREDTWRFVEVYDCAINLDKFDSSEDCWYFEKKHKHAKAYKMVKNKSYYLRIISNDKLSVDTAQLIPKKEITEIIFGC